MKMSQDAFDQLAYGLTMGPAGAWNTVGQVARYLAFLLGSLDGVAASQRKMVKDFQFLEGMVAKVDGPMSQNMTALHALRDVCLSNGEFMISCVQSDIALISEFIILSQMPDEEDGEDNE